MTDKDAMEKAARENYPRPSKFQNNNGMYSANVVSEGARSAFKAGWQSALNGPAVRGLREFAENMAEIEGEIGHFARKALAAFEATKE